MLEKIKKHLNENTKKVPDFLWEQIENKLSAYNNDFIERRHYMSKKSKLTFALSFAAILLIISISIFVLISSQTNVTIEGKPHKAYITFLMGSADMETMEGNITPLRVGVEVTGARVLRTKIGSRLDLRLSSGSAFTLSENTELKLSSFLTAIGSNESTNIDLFRGRLVVEPAKIKDKGFFNINTPTAVAGVRGTRFAISYYPDQEATRVAVNTGQVSVRRKIGLDVSNQAREKIYKAVGAERSVNEGQSILITRERNEQIGEMINSGIDTIQRRLETNQSIDDVREIARARNISEIEASSLSLQEQKLFSDITINRDGIKTTRVAIFNHGGALYVNEAESLEETYRGAFPVGSKLLVKIVKPGFKPFEQILTVPDIEGVFIPSINLQRQTYIVTVDREISQDRIASSFSSGIKPISAPLLNDNKIYFLSSDGNYYCINMGRNQAVLWKTAINAAIDTTPILTEGIIYFGARNGYIYAINSQNGEIIWQKNYGNMMFKSKIVLRTSRLYFGTIEGHVYALSRSNGEIIWKKKLPGGVWSTVAVGNTSVYVGNEDGNVYALDRNSGNQLWVRDLSSRIITPVIAVGDRVVAVNYEGKSFGLQGTTGNIVWEKEIGIIKSHPVNSSGNIFFSVNGKIVIINSSEGSVLRELSLGGNPNILVDINTNKMFISNGGKNVYEYSSSGSLVWQHQLSENVFENITANEKYVFAVTISGVVTKLNRVTTKIIQVRETRVR